MAFRIEEVWAFAAVGEDGEEGIIGEATYLGWVPFVAADRERLEQLKPRAQAIATKLGCTVRLIRLHQRTDVEEILP